MKRRDSESGVDDGVFNRQSAIGNRQSGYSFPEVLFAVAVLGIGFIMIAAIFPAALSQTQATLEETIGTAVTHNGVSYLRGSPRLSILNLPYTNVGLVAPLPPTPPHPGAVFGFFDPRIDNNQPPTQMPAVADTLWNSVKQNLIVADDPRFAFIPMYIRDEGSNFAKLIVIGVRVRNRPEFTSQATSPDFADIERRSPTICAELEPRPVKVKLTDGSGMTNPADVIVIDNLTGGTPFANLSTGSNAKDAAVEGAYIIISDDNKPDVAATPFANEHGRLNGRIYRLGPQRIGNTYELAAGEDMPSSPGPDGNFGTADDTNENMADATAFIVGRGYAGATGNTYSGPSMAVQRYESVIALP